MVFRSEFPVSRFQIRSYAVGNLGKMSEPKNARFWETGAAFPGGFGSVHAIRLGIEPFAELGANSSSLSGSEVDPSCSRRTILGFAPVTVLQSLFVNSPHP